MILSRNIRRVFVGVASLFLLALFVGSFFQKVGRKSPRPPAKAPDSNPFTATVARVIDGDTVVLDDGRKVRYLGVDAPEQGEAFFEQALALNRELVTGGKVRLVPCPARKTDSYGRLLAFVLREKTDVSLALVEAGLATVFDDPACDRGRGAVLWAGMIAAYDRGAGMWADTPADPIDAAGAADHAGSVRKVAGRVENVVESGDWIHAIFGGDWRTDGFSIRVPRANLPTFVQKSRAPSNWKGKRIIAIGRVEKRKHGPYLVCRSPAQILAIE